MLHWHRRLQMWLPPGGHVEPDEDPVTAVLREIEEETGLLAEVVPCSPALPFSVPAVLPAPYTILLEDIPGPDPHQHIDLIYFCRALDGRELRASSADDAPLWVSEARLRGAEPLPRPGGGAEPAPADVRHLGLAAIRSIREAGG